MIHILNGGQFGMSGVSGDDLYGGETFPLPFGEETGMDESKTARDRSSGSSLVEGGVNGSGGARGAGENSSSASERELRQRAQRARLAAGVACLWAGIGVGAMLGGQTVEATKHYAEYAREAIKGCHDVVSEEVCLYVSPSVCASVLLHYNLIVFGRHNRLSLRVKPVGRSCLSVCLCHTTAFSFF